MTGAGSAMRQASAFAIMLDPGRAQAGKPMLVDGCLPVEEFVDTERIARAGLLETQQSATNGGHDFRLAADDPASGILWRQVRDRQRAAIRADHVLDARTHLHGHFTHLLNLTIAEEASATPLTLP